MPPRKRWYRGREGDVSEDGVENCCRIDCVEVEVGSQSSLPSPDRGRAPDLSLLHANWSRVRRFSWWTRADTPYRQPGLYEHRSPVKHAGMAGEEMETTVMGNAGG